MFQPLALSDTPDLAEVQYDAVVIGAGVAGLSFVLQLPDDWRVALLTKGNLGESNTRYAQGGLSAAVGPDDTTLLHEADTLAAGAGLCDPEAVRALVEGAPEAVDWLLSIGTRFDRDAATGDLLLGREAAHSRHRVLHAGGDATGAEIERALVDGVRRKPGVEILDHSFAVDIIVEEGVCAGLLVEPKPGAALVRLMSPTVVIAAGGAGQLWAVTSNPPGATADGLAMALRANVAVANLEFVQFHPTVLAVPGSAPFLVTEAVRGEGAYLRDHSGRRFMVDQHELAELAPRDVVARGIHAAMAADRSDYVYLDLRHLDGEAMYARFPTITRELQARGLDLARDLIPVAPAAHYFIGGIAAGVDGATSLPGLLALGEAACTGVHGANRLASNSLLEGLVFGRNAALATMGRGREPRPDQDSSFAVGSAMRGAQATPAPVAHVVETIQETMSRHVAVVRDGTGLSEAEKTIREAMVALRGITPGNREQWQAMNLAAAALVVTQAAQARKESRGAHFRSDYPAPDPALDQQHSILPDPAAGVWELGTLEAARRRFEPVR